MNTIRVFEYEKLEVDEKTFTQAHFESLVKFNEKNRNKYFTVGHKGVRFSKYVGVIQIGNLAIEILPKADREVSPDEALKSKWHSVLIEMLKVCKLLNLESLTDASLKTSRVSILDIYLNLYLNECQKLLHQGPIKKYRHETKNLTALKGSLQFAEQIKHNFVHSERFYTKHQTYDFNNLLNQIILKAIKVCGKISSNHEVIRKAKVLEIYFPEISNKEIISDDFNRIKFDRKNIRYEKAIGLAKLILLNYNPDLKHGDLHVLALLFDMNKLFEEYVFRSLKRGEEKGDYSVSRQNSTTFWESKTVRPDIVLEKEEHRYIVDTKWKILDEAVPSDDDLKQMYVYNLYFNSERSILLYPDVWAIQSAYGTFRLSHLFDGDQEKKMHKCGIGFIKLVDINDDGGTYLIQNIPDQLNFIVSKFK